MIDGLKHPAESVEEIIIANDRWSREDLGIEVAGERSSADNLAGQSQCCPEPPRIRPTRIAKKVEIDRRRIVWTGATKAHLPT
jgi:hypothetical protein